MARQIINFLFDLVGTITLLLLLLFLRNLQNQTEYNYEKLNLTIMVVC